MKTDDPLTVFTIGHSTNTYEYFVSLLRQSGITAVADVRSAPYSRNFPQFNSDTLKDELRFDGIAYSFLGNELGGRPKKRSLYFNGTADYERMADTSEFEQGLVRVTEGAKRYRIVLMCSEHDPLDCHRCLLVGRALIERGINVRHILANSKIIEHAEIEKRLLEISHLDINDIFMDRKERLAAAYRQRALKVAFSKPTVETKTLTARRSWEVE